MVEPIGVAAAVLTVLGEGILVTSLVAVWRRARRIDDENGAGLLLAGAILVGISTIMRATRYIVGGFGTFDTFVSLILGTVGWVLAWRAILAITGGEPSHRSAGLVLVGTTLGALILYVGASMGGILIQLGISLTLGFAGALVATVGWRLRRDAPGLFAGLAVAAGVLLVLLAWTRAVLIAGARSGDEGLFLVSRLVHGGGVLLAALFAWPAFDQLASLLTPKSGAERSRDIAAAIPTGRLDGQKEDAGDRI